MDRTSELPPVAPVRTAQLFGAVALGAVAIMA